MAIFICCIYQLRLVVGHYSSQSCNMLKLIYITSVASGTIAIFCRYTVAYACLHIGFAKEDWTYASWDESVQRAATRESHWMRSSSRRENQVGVRFGPATKNKCCKDNLHLCLKVETSSGKLYRSAKFCACMLLHLPGSFYAVILVFQNYFLFRSFLFLDGERYLSAGDH